MTNPTVFTIGNKAKDAFWNVVEDTLVEIFGLPRHDAHQKSRDLRTRIELPLPGIDNLSEIFYHNEPFYIACDIAEKELDPVHFDPRYEAILKRHKW